MTAKPVLVLVVLGACVTDDVEVTSRSSALTGAWSAPQRIAELSALGYNDSHPAIRRDGLEIYFLSRRGGGIDELWVSTRFAVTEPWGAPTRVASLAMPGMVWGAPELSDDGLTMWLSRATAITNSIDLFVTTRLNYAGSWSAPAGVLELATTGVERSAHLGVDGKTLYFTRDGDIHVATRQSTAAPWGDIRPINRWNSAADEDNVTLTGDRLEVYFDTRRDGASRIYRSTRIAGEPWSIPEPATELFAGFGPDVTPDGSTMVFAVMDADGTADLYESRR